MVILQRLLKFVKWTLSPNFFTGDILISLSADPIRTFVAEKFIYLKPNAFSEELIVLKGIERFTTVDTAQPTP